MVLSAIVKHTYTLMPSRISLHSTPGSTHSPFALQTSGLPNHLVWATNNGCTKPCARILAPGAQHVPNHMPTLNQSPATPFHKRTQWYFMARSRYPLNSLVLVLFSPFPTIPAMSHYPVFTDRYSPQYGKLTFLLHFVTNFSTFLPLSSPPPLPPRFLIIQLVQSCAHHHPWPLWQNFSNPTPIFPQSFTLFRLCLRSKDNVPV